MVGEGKGDAGEDESSAPQLEPSVEGGVALPPVAAADEDSGTTLFSACVPDLRSTSQLRMLSHDNYDRTIQDLLGITVLSRSGGVPPSALLAPDGADKMNQATWDGFQLAAERIAAEVFGEDELRYTFVECDLVGDTDACLRSTISKFGARAFRRPLTEAQQASFERLIGLGSEITKSGTASEIAEVILTAFLMSPSFLHRLEMNEEQDPEGRYLLSDYEVAQRLSYALWGTMPDSELFAAAAAQQLHTTQQIKQQATRMLNDVRAEAQVDAFHTAYLQIGVDARWDNVTKDVGLFPEFAPVQAETLRAEMLSVLRGTAVTRGGFWKDLLLDSTAFVNKDTAPLYGLPASDYGDELVEVQLDAQTRPGFLTRVGFLSAYSYPDRTSPSQRGTAILRRVLGLAIPEDSILQSPLPEVPELDTVREKFQAVVNDATCQACHQTVDPLGFVLENFDAAGRWQSKEMDTGAPIDPRATVVTDVDEDGELLFVEVEDVRQLAYALAKSTRGAKVYTQRWIDFLLERPESPTPGCLAEDLGPRLIGDNHPIVDMIADVASSELFQVRVLEEDAQ